MSSSAASALGELGRVPAGRTWWRTCPSRYSDIKPLIAPREAAIRRRTSEHFCSSFSALSMASTWPRMRRTRLSKFSLSRDVCNEDPLDGMKYIPYPGMVSNTGAQIWHSTVRRPAGESVPPLSGSAAPAKAAVVSFLCRSLSAAYEKVGERTSFLTGSTGNLRCKVYMFQCIFLTRILGIPCA